MSSPLFRQFLGISRLSALRAALRSESAKPLTPNVFFILGSVTLIVCYSAVVLLSNSRFLTTGGVSTIVVICAVGLILWSRLRDRTTGTFFGGLSHIHTAFAIGVIPALFMVLIFRDSFTQGLAVGESSGGPRGGMHGNILLVILGVSIFAGITEEIIFRGLALSALRRLWHDRSWRDAASITVSSILFGAFHAVLWGPAVGVALAGIGAGLGAGYVASKERLAAVIVYHSAFDFLSLSAAIFLMRG